MISMKIVRILDVNEETEWLGGNILDDSDDFVVVDLGENVAFENAEGYISVQKDYKVENCIWQVHKTDADPFPSQPHAHCISGPTRFVGNKLHLGTRQMFAGATPLGLFLHKKPFTKLIKLIQPKFPSIKLPLES